MGVHRDVGWGWESIGMLGVVGVHRDVRGGMGVVGVVRGGVVGWGGESL